MNDLPRNRPCQATIDLIQGRHPDCVLLFRCPAEYQVYGSDALTARLIGGDLVSVAVDGPDGVAYFPACHLERVVRALLRHFHRVAICEGV